MRDGKGAIAPWCEFGCWVSGGEVAPFESNLISDLIRFKL